MRSRPLMAAGLDAMRFGYVSLDHVRHLHGKWYQRLVAQDEGTGGGSAQAS